MNDSATQPAPKPRASAEGDRIVIKCVGLTKTFKDFWLRDKVRAVDNIDLEIHRGEVFGLLGPNGSGKSTTIKMILGLLHATAGRIAVFGKRPEDVATKKLIGYLPEESYLYPFLNARETLDYYGRLFHQNRAQRDRRIDMLLEMVGLEAVQRRPVREYSKGMQRRIGIAQALINDPQLLVLDEPTTGMDPIGTAQIKELIRKLADKGKTILLCSHLLADVEDVCDRVSIMYGGKVRSQGTVDELLVSQGKTLIQTPQLSDEDIQEIEQVLERRGKAIDRVEKPRQRLEQHFLDIVHRAQAEGLATSGATSGGRIAGFLGEESRGAHLPEDVRTAALIDKLTSGEEGGDEREPREVESAQGRRGAQRAAADVDAEADSSMIASLAGVRETATAQPTSEYEDDEVQGRRDTASSPRVEPVESDADVSLIEGLIGGAGAVPPPRREAPQVDQPTPTRDLQPRHTDAALPRPTAEAKPPATDMDAPADAEPDDPEPTNIIDATPIDDEAADEAKRFAIGQTVEGLSNEDAPDPRRRANEEYLARVGRQPQRPDAETPAHEEPGLTHDVDGAGASAQAPQSEQRQQDNAAGDDERPDASFIEAMLRAGDSDDDDERKAEGQGGEG